MRVYIFVILPIWAGVHFSLAQDPKVDDITNNGNYLIARCGKNDIGGKAEQLISLLREIGEDLPTIIAEANTGTSSEYGFKSLFTSNDAVPAVTANYGKLSESESVLVAGRSQQVTFVCIEPDDPVTAITYNHMLATEPRAAAFSDFGTERIYLAPLFFAGLMRNPEPYRCPVFRRSRMAINSDDILGTTQYGIIIHELMDKYLHLNDLVHAEKYDIRECIKLPPDQQLQNAENYNFYASGVDYIPHVRAAHLRSGHTYRYVNYRSHIPEKPTILFLHGFPSSSFDWRRQFNYFASRGYGVLAPDLLGYGGTDKPADVKAYTLKRQADEIAELLDCVGVEYVLSVGHDLGSPLLSRVATYYPDLSIKHAFLDIGYAAPPLGLTAAGIDALNARILATEGYEPSGYWSFFNESGAGYILDEHQDSVWSVLYTNNDPLYWKTVYGPTGALEAFIKADKRATTGGFVTAEDEMIHNRIFAAGRGGYEPTLNHYRALYRDLNLADENAIPKSTANITKPVLLLTAAKDPIGTPARAELSTRPYAPDLMVKEIDSGHFMMLEKADEVNEALEEFFGAI
ncbi:MAG: hypothetical protein Q9181_005436 [Wetmoreana brouardii]